MIHTPAATKDPGWTDHTAQCTAFLLLPGHKSPKNKGSSKYWTSFILVQTECETCGEGRDRRRDVWGREGSPAGRVGKGGAAGSNPRTLPTRTHVRRPRSTTSRVLHCLPVHTNSACLDVPSVDGVRVHRNGRR